MNCISALRTSFQYSSRGSVMDSMTFTDRRDVFHFSLKVAELEVPEGGGQQGQLSVILTFSSTHDGIKI